MSRSDPSAPPAPQRRGRWPWWLAGGSGATAVLGVVVLLPLVALGVPPPPAPAGARAAVAVAGLHPVLADAYTRAAAAAGGLVPGCRLRPAVLAGIAQVESDNAAGREVAPDGTVRPGVVGIPLDGRAGTRAAADTDGGVLDGDSRWDRAVGPLQFIPSSWRAYGADASGDGVADPQNAFDAARAAVVHLCGSSPGDLDEPVRLRAALFAYNRSNAYVAEVLAEVADFDARWAAAGAAAAPGPGGHALPLERRWFEANPHWLTKPHHDYPAADLPVPVGTPVYVAAAGTVRAVTAGGRCGGGVVVAGADGFDWVYCHASEVVVAAGQPVAAGQLLLRSGNTGNSTGPHLHLGVEGPGGRRCPQALLTAWFRGEAAGPASAPTAGCT